MVGSAVNLLRNGSVVAGLGFELRLRGPNTFIINGKVWITVCGIDVDFRVDHLGRVQSLPTPTVDPVAVLRQALRRQEARTDPTARPHHGVSFARGDAVEAAVDPLGGVRLTQRAVPLGIAIEKIGEAQVSASAGLLDLRAFGVAVAGHRRPRRPRVRSRAFLPDLRVREAARNRVRAHKAGFEIAAEALTGPVASAIVEAYGYEFIEIGEDEIVDASPLFPFATIAHAPVSRWMEAHHRAHTAPLDPVALVVKAVDAPAFKQGRLCRNRCSGRRSGHSFHQSPASTRGRCGAETKSDRRGLPFLRGSQCPDDVVFADSKRTN